MQTKAFNIRCIQFLWTETDSNFPQHSTEDYNYRKVIQMIRRLKLTNIHDTYIAHETTPSRILTIYKFLTAFWFQKKGEMSRWGSENV